MVGNLLVQKSSQNNSIKDELEEALYVALEGAPKISLHEAQKIAKKCEQKGTALNLKFGSLRVLYFLYKAEQAEFVDISN